MCTEVKLGECHGYTRHRKCAWSTFCCSLATLYQRRPPSVEIKGSKQQCKTHTSQHFMVDWGKTECIFGAQADSRHESGAVNQYWGQSSLFVCVCVCLCSYVCVRKLFIFTSLTLSFSPSLCVRCYSYRGYGDSMQYRFTSSATQLKTKETFQNTFSLAANRLIDECWLTMEPDVVSASSGESH